METPISRDPGLVSIITPAYNSGRFVGESIRSVLAQTYSHWEMIIVDDASTDSTRNEIGKFDDPRIRYVRLNHNVGGAEARNTALRMARGRWIAFLDSDDVWHPDKLEHQINFMERNGYGFSYTAYSEMDEDGKLLGTHISGPEHITRNGMIAYCWPGCLTVMYDADRIGLVQAPHIRKNNDYALWLLVSRYSDCHLLSENLAVYRVRTGSVSDHGYVTLIKWHYRLFRVMGNNAILSLLRTGSNLICGTYKKLVYRKRNF